MTTTATTDESLRIRHLIADHLDAVADLIASAGMGDHALTPAELGFPDTTPEELRAEVDEYRATGVLP